MEERAFLEKDQEISFRKGIYLEHWNQCDKYQYVTFRLADSLPAKIREEITDTRKRFLEHHPQPWDNNTLNLYTQTATKLQNSLLDKGYGECVLRLPEVREIFLKSLWIEHGKTFYIDSYVIMPNHVHLLVRMIGDNTIEEAIGVLKRCSALKINKFLKRRGPVWYRDFFDRLVRSEEHYKHCRSYIQNNPKQLPYSDYTLYMGD